ncbi:protein phosphatase 1 regulatory subunit 37 [Petromyzon marinus]|uniref:protein phosphatase 1 regulatory subunit 37 n=1 Tax=Petromyzon marinus TaxID=7757 RepID=UPI003F700004
MAGAEDGPELGLDAALLAEPAGGAARPAGPARRGRGARGGGGADNNNHENNNNPIDNNYNNNSRGDGNNEDNDGNNEQDDVGYVEGHSEEVVVEMIEEVVVEEEAATTHSSKETQTETPEAAGVADPQGSSRPALPAKRVSFPEDAGIVSGAVEPRDPWRHALDATVEVIITAYKESCLKLNVRPIPKLIKQLQDITELSGRVECLDLRAEKLDYKTCETLEEVFKRLQFNEVNAESTSLDEDGASALFDMIEYYESAVHLNISFNKHIGVRGWQAAANLMKKTGSLQILDARNSPVADQALPFVARALRMHSSLAVLHMENASMSGRPLLLLVSALKMNLALRELYLADNKLNSGQDALQLGNLVKFNSTLQLLDLRNNSLMDSGLQHVCEGLKEQKKGLVTLVVWNNQLSHVGMQYVASMLPCTQSLETLNLGHNSVGNEGVLRLKDGLIANRSVLRLGLACTRITCEGAVAVAEFIAESPRIVRIDLRENDVKTGGLMALALALKVNTSLARLDLDKEPKKEQVKSFLDTQKSLQTEIQNYCKRNRDAARDREEDGTGPPCLSSPSSPTTSFAALDLQSQPQQEQQSAAGTQVESDGSVPRPAGRDRVEPGAVEERSLLFAHQLVATATSPPPPMLLSPLPPPTPPAPPAPPPPPPPAAVVRKPSRFRVTISEEPWQSQVKSGAVQHMVRSGSQDLGGGKSDSQRPGVGAEESGRGTEGPTASSGDEHRVRRDGTQPGVSQADGRARAQQSSGEAVPAGPEDAALVRTPESDRSEVVLTNDLARLTCDERGAPMDGARGGSGWSLGSSAIFEGATNEDLAAVTLPSDRSGRGERTARHGEPGTVAEGAAWRPGRDAAERRRKELVSGGNGEDDGATRVPGGGASCNGLTLGGDGSTFVLDHNSVDQAGLNEPPEEEAEVAAAAPVSVGPCSESELELALERELERELDEELDHAGPTPAVPNGLRPELVPDGGCLATADGATKSADAPPLGSPEDDAGADVGVTAGVFGREMEQHSQGGSQETAH